MILQNFRLLTDENIDHEVVEYLRVLGFDVFDIKDNGLFGMSDDEFLALSVSQQSVVVSQAVILAPWFFEMATHSLESSSCGLATLLPIFISKPSTQYLARAWTHPPPLC